jgi:hypothetical protein
MSIVDDAIAKIIAEKNAANKEIELLRAEAKKWRQIALGKSDEDTTDRETNSTEHNPDSP